MRRNILTILLTGLLINSSCTKFLDVKPVGQLIPTKVEDLENLLNSNNTVELFFVDNNRGSFYAHLGDNLRISDNQAKYLFLNTNPNVERLAAYKFYYPYFDPNKSAPTWDNAIYKAAGIFNVVIDEVTKLNAQDSDLGKMLIAQAKAGRAWSYMVGGLAYGPMFDPSGSNDTRVLPYRKASSPNEPHPGLSTTGEIMDLVERDLLEALDAPLHVANPSRASITTVHALLAQLYMYKRDWVKMSEHADLAWTKALSAKGNADNLIYNYNDFFYRPDDNATPTPGTDVETVLDLQGPDNLHFQTNNREFLLFRTGPVGTNSYPSDEFLSLFDTNSDKRYKLFALKKLGYSTTVGGVRYNDGIQRYYMKDSKMISNAGLTYPELLLMRSEANARNGRLGLALQDLNLLRKYRYSGNTTDLAEGSSLDKDALLYEILKERRRELPMASFQRVLDIKRLALDSGKPWCKTRIEHVIDGKSYAADVKSKYYTLQISNSIISFNPQWGLQPNNDPYLPASF